MKDLSTISHPTNWGRIGITRIGEGRHTRYEISAGEMQQEQEQATLPIVNKFTRGKYGHCVRY